MGCGIMRAQRCQHTKALAMIRHALREVTVANALDGGKPPRVIAGYKDGKACREKLASLVAAAKAAGQRWRKDAVEVVDFLFTTSSQKDLTPDRRLQYLEDSIQWVKDRWPHATILTAAVHYDETTPHLQLLVAPTDEKGYFRAKEMFGGYTEMSKMQDHFWEQVSQKYDLERGEKGSQAKHIPVRKLYAAMNAGGDKPKFKKVPSLPPEPTLADKLAGRADEMEAARARALKERKKVIEQNQKERDRIIALADVAARLHPAMVEKQAIRYRDAVRAEERAQAMLTTAQEESAESKRLRKQAEEEFAIAQRVRDEAQKLARIGDEAWAKHGAKMLDEISKKLDKGYLAGLARKLGIELKQGHGVIDQVRRAGLAKTMLEAANVVMRADKNLAESVQRRQTEQMVSKALEKPKG